MRPRNTITEDTLDEVIGSLEDIIENVKDLAHKRGHVIQVYDALEYELKMFNNWKDIPWKDIDTLYDMLHGVRLANNDQIRIMELILRLTTTNRGGAYIKG